MTNMSYCRFENTVRDLEDCYESMNRGDQLSESEKQYKTKLIDLCKEISQIFDSDSEKL